MENKEIFKRTRETINPLIDKDTARVLNLYHAFATEEASKFYKKLEKEQKQKNAQGENVIITGTTTFRLKDFKKYVKKHDKSLIPIVGKMTKINEMELSVNRNKK